MLTAAALDDPVGDPAEDLLNRDAFAATLARLIDGAGAASFRLGVFGDWGEGKTSVLRLMERHLRASGHACVWFTPWVAPTVEVGWIALLGAIAAELHLTRGALHAGTTARALTARAVPGSDLAWKLRLAQNALADPLREVAQALPREGGNAGYDGDEQTTAAPAAVSDERDAPRPAAGAPASGVDASDDDMGEGWRRLLDAIYGALVGRRLVVFVDDLDRTDAALVPKLLLTLREVLDLPGFVYVVAVSPQIVGEGLRTVHQGWAEAGRFLEKIVEVPTFVPQPREADFGRALDGFLARVGTSVRPDPVRAIAPVLPRNPRRLKLLLRYLASLRDATDRFDDEEVDWERLYLCQLLRLEFPVEAHQLADDAKAVAELASGKDREEMARRGGVRKDGAGSLAELSTRADLRHIADDKDAVRKSRFRVLCDAIRDRGSFAERALGVAQMFRLLEHPPILTWREYGRIWDDVHPLLAAGGHDEAGARVQSWLRAADSVAGTVDDEEAARARFAELFVRTVKAREGQLEAAIREDTAAALQEQLAMVRVFTDLLRLLGIGLRGFKDGALGAEAWQALVGHFYQWAHFNRPAYHARLRDDEASLLIDLAGEVPAEAAAAILASGYHDDVHHHGRGGRPESWRRAVRAAYSRLGETAAEQALETFNRPGGIRSLLLSDAPAARLLFDPDSAFHAPRIQARLRQTAQRARIDGPVYENVSAYWSQLTYGAFGEHFGAQPSYLSRLACQNLLRSAGLTAALWKAVVSRPLNPRTAGSLRQDRDHIIRLGVPARSLPTPGWLRALERMGFWASADATADATAPAEGGPATEA